MYKTIIKTTLLVLFSTAHIITIGQSAPTFGWAQSISGNNNDQPTSIAADSRNGVYCYGNSNSTTLRAGAISLPGTGGTDIFLVKYDTLGVLQWSKRFGNGGANSAAYITTDKNSNIIITGNFEGTLNLGGVTLTSSGGQDVFIAKLSPTGNTIWARGFTGNANDEAGPILCDNQLNCYTAGKFTSTNFSIGAIGLTNGNTHNLYYCKLDSNGNAIWANRGSTAAISSFYDIESSGNGLVSFIGKLQSGGSLSFSPAITVGMTTPFHSSFALVTDTAGNFNNQLLLFGNRFFGSNTVLTKQQHLLLGGYNTYSSLPPAAAVYQLNYSNFSFVKVVQPTVQQHQGNSIGYDVAVDPQNRVFQLTSAIGTVSFVPGQSLSFPSSVAVLWELDSLLNPKNALPMQYQAGFSSNFTKLVVDTITGKLYGTGYINKNTAGGNFLVGPNSLPYDSLNDVVVFEVGRPSALRAFAGTDTSICAGDSLYIGKPTGAAGGRPPYTYAWSPNTDVTNPAAAYTIAKPTVSRSYVLTVTDGDGSTAKDTIAITVNPRPHMGADTMVYQNCYNDITNLTQVYNTMGLSAAWNTANPTAAAPGVYRLIVSNANNCTDTVFVTVTLEVATWTGAISSDWHTPGNWSTNKVPTTITHVIITSGTPNSCTISSNASVASLQLRNGAVLTTGNGAQVTVVGNCAVLPPG